MPLCFCNKLNDYIVALEADEVHCHWDRAVAVSVQGFDVVEEICEKLVASFEHTQSDNVVAPHLFHDLPGEPLRPASHGFDRERERENREAQFSVSQRQLSLPVC